MIVGTCTRCGTMDEKELSRHDSDTCGVVYSIADNVISMAKDDSFKINPYASGYGRKIPTRWMVKYLLNNRYKSSRWRRVYMMQYGNAGSAYILVGDKIVFLDSDTEYRLEKLG